MNHLKGYATSAEAERSKAAGLPGAWLDDKCPCGLVHVKQAKAVKAATVAPRAKPGSMTSAVSLVLSGEATVAEAARLFEVDPERLEDRAEREFRRACMERDHHTCAECGAMATEVQHRVARGMGGNSDPKIAFGRANGISLCPRSHRKAEKRDPELYRRGFWRWQGEDPERIPVEAATEYGPELRWLLPDGGYSLADPYAEEAEAA